MNYRNVSGAALIAVVCTGCGGDPDAFDPDSAADDLGTLQEALGESTCGSAAHSSTSNNLVTLDISAAQQDNPSCRWAYVHQVTNVVAGTYFFTKWNDDIPLNDLNCASSNVRMDVYKLTSSGWTLDASRFDIGDWRSNVCGVPNVNRQVRSSGTYKLILNGSYTRLSPQFASDIRVTSMRATL